MNAKLLAVVGVGILLVAGVVGALVTGFGPAPGGDSGSDVESFPTETPSNTGSDGASGDGASGDGGTSDATATATDTPPFTFAIGNIEECGRTCRDVTSTLTNRRDATADDVTVYTRIFAGNGTDGDQVWQGSEDVGALDAGESYTATKRVELSYSDGYKIERNDGWITVQTTVETADQTVTFTERRQVA
ncbi:hypothetical protein SAMN05216559_0601 [Halomicrobium zhouii]|uniref:Uncharacterized protein n=1 Tax=Halomicrobium zhouii TaxID=767519 RepID=A0A1I6KDF7_9EURY|nr:hypothetical protein [Halomicrobium zhouii]SFR89262.1 hypothetical protein SAMN05216559_0601 [Halomicrobium zhouii]